VREAGELVGWRYPKNRAGVLQVTERERSNA